MQERGLLLDMLHGRGSSPVFVVSGPSGAGKTSLCTEVLARLSWLRAAVSHTTRPARPGEQEGRDYFFVDRDTFERMIRNGDFLEWAEVHGHLYGSSMENLRSTADKRSLLFEVDCKGAKQIRREMQEAVLVFVMTPSLDDLIRRIQGRGRIGQEELSVRIRAATFEIQQVSHFDYLVVNESFDEAVNELQSIIVAESCRRRYRGPSWTERWAKEVDAYSEGPLPNSSSPSPKAKGSR